MLLRIEVSITEGEDSWNSNVHRFKRKLTQQLLVSTAEVAEEEKVTIQRVQVVGPRKGGH